MTHIHQHAIFELWELYLVLTHVFLPSISLSFTFFLFLLSFSFDCFMETTISHSQSSFVYQVAPTDLLSIELNEPERTYFPGEQITGTRPILQQSDLSQR